MSTEKVITLKDTQPVHNNEPRRRRAGGDRYRDQVMGMLRKNGYDVSDSTYLQDMREASDLVVNGDGCAMRMRSSKALQLWPNDFTIRALRGVWHDTEFAKIMNGCARYAVFGFVESSRVVLMRMLDLDVFRNAILSNVERYDRTTAVATDGVEYLVFSIKEFPPELVLDVWDNRH